MYVDTTYETINIAVQNWTEAAILAFLLAYLRVPGMLSAGIGVVYGLAQLVVDEGFDYISITENKYFVNNIEFGQAMNCYHALVTCYSYDSEGRKDIFEQYWEYYQYLL